MSEWPKTWENLCIPCFCYQVQWKAYGNVGMAQRIEHCFETALYLRDRCKTTPGFRLLIDEPECTNVCFWYIPPSLRGQTEDAEWWQKLSKVSETISGRRSIIYIGIVFGLVFDYGLYLPVILRIRYCMYFNFLLFKHQVLEGNHFGSESSHIQDILMIVLMIYLKRWHPL